MEKEISFTIPEHFSNKFYAKYCIPFAFRHIGMARAVKWFQEIYHSINYSYIDLCKLEETDDVAYITYLLENSTFRVRASMDKLSQLIKAYLENEIGIIPIKRANFFNIYDYLSKHKPNEYYTKIFKEIKDNVDIKWTKEFRDRHTHNIADKDIEMGISFIEEKFIPPHTNVDGKTETKLTFIPNKPINMGQLIENAIRAHNFVVRKTEEVMNFLYSKHPLNIELKTNVLSS